MGLFVAQTCVHVYSIYLKELAAMKELEAMHPKQVVPVILSQREFIVVLLIISVFIMARTVKYI